MLKGRERKLSLERTKHTENRFQERFRLAEQLSGLAAMGLTYNVLDKKTGRYEEKNFASSQHLLKSKKGREIIEQYSQIAFKNLAILQLTHIVNILGSMPEGKDFPNVPTLQLSPSVLKILVTLGLSGTLLLAACGDPPVSSTGPSDRSISDTIEDAVEPGAKRFDSKYPLPDWGGHNPPNREPEKFQQIRISISPAHPENSTQHIRANQYTNLDVDVKLEDINKGKSATVTISRGGKILAKSLVADIGKEIEVIGYDGKNYIAFQIVAAGLCPENSQPYPQMIKCAMIQWSDKLPAMIRDSNQSSI